MNLSKYYGKNVRPSCEYCLYGTREDGEISCGKGRKASTDGGCGAFRYEPTLREPKEPPSLGKFKPEDFQL